MELRRSQERISAPYEKLSQTSDKLRVVHFFENTMLEVLTTISRQTQAISMQQQ
jgi:hypothetical protein